MLERLQKLVPLLATLVFTILVGLELAKLIWLLVPEPSAGQWVPRPVQPATTTVSNPRQSVDIAQLTSAKLFGDFSETATDTVAAANLDAPDTNLRLKLRGIFAMEDPLRSRALIEPASGELMPYAIGMDIPGGAKLHSIYPDRVLLKRGGKLETLRLERDETGQGIASSGRPADNSNAYRLSSAPQILGSDTAAKLSSIREELLNDPTKASQYLRLQPARSNGALKGYRIYPGRKRELFREAGLRPGDIVTAVNGVTLDDPTKSLQLLGDLSQAQEINLQIERGGQLQSVSVNLN